MKGFAALALTAALLAALVAGAASARNSSERAREYSRVMLSLQKLKAIQGDVRETFRQVMESAEGETIQERVLDVARKLALAEQHLEEKYRENGLDVGFGACKDENIIDFSSNGEDWDDRTVPLAASILYWEDEIIVSSKGRSLVKKAPVIPLPCLKGFARSGNAEYGFDLNEFN
ncbi:hypothetical protein COX85_01550 [Candidatus Micrarchaeota archaeon CG_4_10_14_0_2_um_filter_55_9]|nr:MAG: hypothetical protein AUJ15_02325 [Candidatus Micrarchaeota archaeon CG1_02_55_41]PIZ91886.1 MAG: hypothetical protein COX85_01550 [Candidatus Micrarchaeota archaeon CG_4_10_14_0_2_um_filter_55_9]PJD01213.1 MAG: hypothetical protein COU38_02030 [Candidatus Micrarchaeota archaeon CG10_big_fil_rev_8_21_14_0_10_54_18]